ncbi:MAG: hypothetical protein L0H73_13770, partial [Nitrococcus sp.]|nr:hypothetical protein [Nitrococcus sp.]
GVVLRFVRVRRLSMKQAQLSTDERQTSANRQTIAFIERTHLPQFGQHALPQRGKVCSRLKLQETLHCLRLITCLVQGAPARGLGLLQCIVGAYCYIAALTALDSERLAEWNGIAVQMPAAEDESTMGGTAQMLAPLTSAAAANRFRGSAR